MTYYPPTLCDLREFLHGADLKDAPPGLGGASFALYGVTVRPRVRVMLARVALIVTSVDEVTTFVVIVNVFVVAAGLTTTVAGTVAAAVLFEEQVTGRPAAGAGELMLSVPTAFRPPLIEVTLIVIEFRTGGKTVRVSVLPTPLRLTRIVET